LVYPFMRSTRRAPARPRFDRPCAALAILVGLTLGPPPAQAQSFDATWKGVRWGEPALALLQQFGNRATTLQRPLDFGDSYANFVLRDVELGGVPLIAFFQLDKTTGGLKRIQLERPRQGVNPAAARAVLGGLRIRFGEPDLICGNEPSPAHGYQAGEEWIWRRDGEVIRAVFRDTTMEALTGCFAARCGLTGQLLVRISPPSLGEAACAAAPRDGPVRRGGRG
jgi:hypothetical protein